MAVALNKLFVSLGAALACSVTAQAAGYPDHPINMVVPFAAGGPTDNVARALAEAMRPVLGETIVVENKGGAGGSIGTARSPAPNRTATTSC